MKPKVIVVLLVTHGLAVAAGFVGGIYALPILIAPPAPAAAEMRQVEKDRVFVAQFARDRQDSDALHWGEGEVSIAPDAISFTGELAPGPDYRLYLSPEFVESEARFNALKSSMVDVGDVRTFDGFIVPLASDVDPAQYSAVIVWCESFGQFITSGSYR